MTQSNEESQVKTQKYDDDLLQKKGHTFGANPLKPPESSGIQIKKSSDAQTSQDFLEKSDKKWNKSKSLLYTNEIKDKDSLQQNIDIKESLSGRVCDINRQFNVIVHPAD